MSKGLKTMLRRMRRGVHEWMGKDVRAPIERRCVYEVLGSEYGGWAVCVDALSRDSVVYCFGVGEDASFDLALIERLGCTVHAFDPTPKSMAWVTSQRFPPQFQFHACGLAAFDGTARFALPQPDFVSYSMNAAGTGETVEAPVKRLVTLMGELGHDRLDVLKMDIKGAEVGVIADLVKHGPTAKQLLVEFHHETGDRAGVAQTAELIGLLRQAGYRLFHRSAVGKECSFIHEG